MLKHFNKQFTCTNVFYNRNEKCDKDNTHNRCGTPHLGSQPAILGSLSINKDLSPCTGTVYCIQPQTLPAPPTNPQPMWPQWHGPRHSWRNANLIKLYGNQTSGESLEAAPAAATVQKWVISLGNSNPSWAEPVSLNAATTTMKIHRPGHLDACPWRKHWAWICSVRSGKRECAWECVCIWVSTCVWGKDTHGWKPDKRLPLVCKCN